MPVIVAAIARQVIMAIATGAVITIAQNLLDGTFRELVNQIRSDNGLSEEEARDVFFNLLVDLTVNSAAIGAVLKTKMAVKTAEFLGLTSKGFVKRKLTPKAAAVVASGGSVVDKKKAAGLILKIFRKVGNPTSLIWLFLGFTQFIEQGVYQPKQANDQYERYTGVRPFAEKGISLSPGNMDAEKFSDLARSLEAGGIRGFNDPVNRQSRVYSREDLAAIIDYAYGKAVLNGQKINDYRGILPLIRPYLIGGTNTPSPSSSQQNTSPAPLVATQTKVFTGVVSQGTVGAGLKFTPRPDDLIEDAQELQAAINNNVAPYLASLLSKVTYEIKVVPSVIVNGVSLRGQVQQIQSGSLADGTPKYKTVVNKFAVANLYLITDRGTRSKLTSIVLGPVNAIKFNPTPNDLVTVSAAVSKSIIAQGTDEISTVVSNTPTRGVKANDFVDGTGVRVVTDKGTKQEDVYVVRLPRKEVEPEFYDAPQPENRPSVRVQKQTIWNILSEHSDLLDAYGGIGNAIGRGRANTLHSETVSWYKNLSEKDIEVILNSRKKGAVESPPIGQPTPAELSATAQMSPTQNMSSAALTASTLSEYYAAKGEKLPSTSERAALYQQLGLGQAAFYTGTAEQNTKLLMQLLGSPL
jgi:hypothetical protein